MSEEQQLTGVNTTNTREYKIKQFLAKPPARAHFLTFKAQVNEGTEMALGEWEKHEVAPVLALTLVEMLDHHAVELGGVVHAVLAWCDANGAQVKAMPLQRQATHITEPRELVARSLQGDATSLVLQAQRQQEVMSRVYMAGINSTLSMHERMADRAMGLLDAQTSRLAKLEQENAELRGALQELQALLEAREAGAEPSETSEAQLRALKLVEQFAPMLVARLLAPPVAAQPS